MSESSSGQSGLTEQIFKQRVDHFGQTKARFSQRYWIDSRFVANGGDEAPILLRLDGEGYGESFIAQSDLRYFATSLGARVIHLEHRYYGKSQPFADLSNEHLKYLTIDNVIADIVDFQRAITRRYHFHGRWIVIGGSYSGTLAAIYRQRHPELVVGALASSAPLHARETQPTPFEKNIVVSSIQIPVYDPKNPFLKVGARAFAFQACRELGFWVDFLVDGLRMPDDSFCQAAFHISHHASAVAWNRRFYLPLLSASPGSSNILFTSGTRDSWSNLTIRSSDERETTSLSTFTIQDGAHESDLYNPQDTDSDSVRSARALFLKLANQWLSGHR